MLVDHLPEIITSALVVGGGIFVRYKFSTKREIEKEFKRMEDLCKENRVVCQTGICRKIESAKASAAKDTDALALGARDNVRNLDGILKEITAIKVNLAGIRQYMEDVANKNIEIQ